MAAPAAAAALPGVLAPESVTRLSGRAEEVRPGVWEITVGEAVDAWVSANGPAEVTNYNLVKLKGTYLGGMQRQWLRQEQLQALAPPWTGTAPVRRGAAERASASRRY